MFKKTLVMGSLLTVLSFALVSPVSAQEVAATKCGFWAKLFGKCTPYDQTAAAMNARLGTSSKEAKLRDMKLASSTAGSITAEQIQCVGSAIATREASLTSSMATYGQAINSAHSTRATDLATAYSKTTQAELRAGISVAWKAFNSSTKSAQKAWRTSKESAWSAYKTAVKACNAPTTLTDSANSVTEISGS